ncbi:hypothetical protein, partial [Mammaliicoccus vitulinus]|uniref:hypothetical protein n=1 Tax=Mammaliicoccus vitulinus TaxID=71237 RepID=UPI000D4FB200
MIDLRHNTFVKSKINDVHFMIEQLVEVISDSKIKQYGDKEVIKLNEINSTIGIIELFCFTHDYFERFNSEYVEDAKVFYN